MSSTQVSHSALQHLAIRSSDVVSATAVTNGLTQYSISLDVLADPNFFGADITTSIGLDVDINLPQDVIR